jgi:uncharacterized protein
MPLVLDSPGNINLVRSYTDGVVRVGDQQFTRCCVVTPQRLIGDWPPNSFDEVTVTQLPALLAHNPEVVLIGVRGAQRFAPAALRRAFAAQNIGLETMELGAACRTYNVLAQEQRKVLAVLFPA